MAREAHAERAGAEKKESAAGGEAAELIPWPRFLGWAQSSVFWPNKGFGAYCYSMQHCNSYFYQ